MSQSDVQLNDVFYAVSSIRRYNSFLLLTRRLFMKITASAAASLDCNMKVDVRKV